VLVMRGGQTVPLKRAPKSEIAHRVLDQIMQLHLAAHSST